MEDDRIDFSSLDPARDGDRWQRLAGEAAARAQARRRSVGTLLASWARPALAAAAVIALGVWGTTIWRARSAPSPQVMAREAATSELLAWAYADVVPEDALDLLRAVRP